MRACFGVDVYVYVWASVCICVCVLAGGGERETEAQTQTERQRQTQREIESQRERIPVVEIRTVWFFKDFFSHIKGPYCFVSQLSIVSVPCGLCTVFITAQRVHPSRRKVWTLFR